MKIPSKVKNLKNKRFGRLIVKEFYEIRNHRTYWLAICDCGKETIVQIAHLSNGHTQSCGCIRLEVLKKRNTTHGFADTKNKQKFRFYLIWSNMQKRCLNSNSAQYKDYGGRGIKVCERWLEAFENFRDDMYESYLKHIEKFGEKETTLDRIEVDGNYELSNCKWSTYSFQQRNRRNSTGSKNYETHRYWQNVLNSSLRYILKSGTNKSKNIKYFGCDTITLRKHIESQFTKDMTWNNYGFYTKKGKKVWQIDHIKQCHEFDLSIVKDRYLCYNYTNLRPLWAKINQADQYRVVKKLSLTDR